MNRPFSITPLSPMVRVNVAGTLVILALSAVGYAINVRPFLERASRAAGLRAELSGARSDLESARARLERTRNELRQAPARGAEQPLALAPLQSLNERMTEISTLARTPPASLTIRQTTPGEPRPTTRYTLVPVKIAGEGTFPGAVEFLARLAQHRRDVGVGAFKLTGDPLRPGVARFEIELGWYAQPATARAGEVIGAARAGRDDAAGQADPGASAGVTSP